MSPPVLTLLQVNNSSGYVERSRAPRSTDAPTGDASGFVVNDKVPTDAPTGDSSGFVIRDKAPTDAPTETPYDALAGDSFGYDVRNRSPTESLKDRAVCLFWTVHAVSCFI